MSCFLKAAAVGQRADVSNYLFDFATQQLSRRDDDSVDRVSDLRDRVVCANVHGVDGVAIGAARRCEEGIVVQAGAKEVHTEKIKSLVWLSQTKNESCGKCT